MTQGLAGAARRLAVPFGRLQLIVARAEERRRARSRRPRRLHRTRSTKQASRALLLLGGAKSCMIESRHSITLPPPPPSPLPRARSPKGIIHRSIKIPSSCMYTSGGWRFVMSCLVVLCKDGESLPPAAKLLAKRMVAADVRPRSQPVEAAAQRPLSDAKTLPPSKSSRALLTTGVNECECQTRRRSKWSDLLVVG